MTSELLDQPEFTGQPIKIFICSTPRSGSYMLCRFMINAGLGVPHEYFNPVIMRQIAPRFGLARDIAGLKWRCRGLRDHLPFGKADRATEVDFLTKYLTALIPKRCQGGIFGAKIHYDQYIRVLDNPVGQRLLNGGLFVHIFREDLLEQAVSRNFAYVTGRWGIDKTVTTPPSARTDLLDVTGIDRELETLADEDRGWRVFFAKNGLSPMSISYEQFCKEPTGFVAAIAQRIGLDPHTLERGYSEPVAPSRTDDPALPPRSEVVRRYLSVVRKFSGAETRAGESLTPARPRETVK